MLVSLLMALVCLDSTLVEQQGVFDPTTEGINVSVL